MDRWSSRSIVLVATLGVAVLVCGCDSPDANPGLDAEPPLDAKPPLDAAMGDAGEPGDGGATADADLDASDASGSDAGMDGGGPSEDAGVDASNPGEDAAQDASTPPEDAGVDAADPSAKRVFRMDSVVLADPHLVVHTQLHTGFGTCTVCQDVTHEDRTHRCTYFGGSFDIAPFKGINPAIDRGISEDNSGDGFLDLAFLLVFDAHDQQDAGGGALALSTGACDASGPTTCSAGGAPTALANGTYINHGQEDCLGVIPGTLGPLAQVAPEAPSGPCFVSEPMSFELILDLDLGGDAREPLVLLLQGAQVAGQWEGDPATGIAKGLLRGFLSMQAADLHSLTFTVDDPGFEQITVNLGRDLLPDGGNAHGCAGVSRAFPDGLTAGSNVHRVGQNALATCSDAGDSRDLLNPDAGPSYDNCGWWFYFNFTGTWVENATGF
jgi:hypothetical protein